MVTRAAEVAVVRRPLLFAAPCYAITPAGSCGGRDQDRVSGRRDMRGMGWADAGIHVENDLRRRVAVMNLVDPHPVHVGQGFNVRVGGQKASTFASVKTSHLAGGSGLFRNGMAADDPSHDRVEAEPVGIVHVVVPAKASENGLAERPDKTMTTVLPTTGVGEYVPGNLGPSDRIPDTATSRRRMRPWCHETPASADGQNRASKPRLPFHPSGEPYQHPKSAYNALIPIPESGCGVVKSHGHLGNDGMVDVKAIEICSHAFLGHI